MKRREKMYLDLNGTLLKYKVFIVPINHKGNRLLFKNMYYLFASL